MDRVFLLQLMASFILGGLFVGVQSWASEKAPRALAGIIISLPSTIIVNLFFLGLILSVEDFAKVLPIVPAPLGFSFVLITTYIYLAKYLEKFISSRILQIAIISPLAIITWLFFSVPLVLKGFDNLILSLIIYVIFIAFAQYSLSRNPESHYIDQEIHYSILQNLSRAIFSGAMVALTVYLGKTLGPLWGGVMTMFPAAYLSAIVIIHFYHGHKKLASVFANSALGSITLVLYAFVAHYGFPVFGVYVGTFFAIFASVSFSFFLSRLKRTE